jgi:hypothetical protein
VPDGNLRLAAVGQKDEDPSAVLIADAPAIKALAAVLRGLEVDSWTTRLGDPPVDEPNRLGRLTIRLTEAPALRVDVTDGALEISGSYAGLHRLAEELDAYLEYNDLDEAGMHTHYDSQDYLAVNDPWIEADSTLLMVAGWVPDPA